MDWAPLTIWTYSAVLSAKDKKEGKMCQDKQGWMLHAPGTLHHSEDMGVRPTLLTDEDLKCFLVVNSVGLTPMVF